LSHCTSSAEIKGISTHTFWETLVLHCHEAILKLHASVNVFHSQQLPHLQVAKERQERQEGQEGEGFVFDKLKDGSRRTITRTREFNLAKRR